MCFAVYLGTDHPLQTCQWDAQSRRVYLAALTVDDEPVRPHFSTEYVYYAGSRLRCSCGFFGSGMVFTDDPDMMREYEESQESAGALVVILEQLLATSGVVEVLVTWDGRESEPPARRRAMAPEDFLSPLRRLSPDADEEIQFADASVETQDFIVAQRPASEKSAP